MNKFELGILKDYFRNIVMACNNEEHDERLYIKTVAECGLTLLKSHGIH